MSDTLIRLRNYLGAAPRINWKRKSIGFDKEQQYLELILNHVVIGDPETRTKRSNSVIVYGPPGSGKSTFVETTLSKLSEDLEGEFYRSRAVVRLNGIICTDFRSSIEEICWQLKFTDFVNENRGDNSDDELDFSIANFDDRLEQIMEFLKTRIQRLNKSIIFIIDKLELFAEQPNQGLLYNLFDLSANFSSSICIIGITDRVDVLELFEKRVKSRFSHRQINLVGGYDFDKYKGIAKQLLVDKYDEQWNLHVDSLFENIELIRIFQSIFDTDMTIRQLTSFLFSVCLIAEDKLTISHFQQVFEQSFRCNNHVKTALDLPISELLVLLSIYKQMQNNKQQAWQPSQLYKIVEKMISSFGLKKDDYLRAATRLEALELIVPVSNSQRNVGGVKNIGEIYFKCELTIQEFQDIWRSYPQLPSSFQELL